MLKEFLSKAHKSWDSDKRGKTLREQTEAGFSPLQSQIVNIGFEFPAKPWSHLR